MRKTKGFTLIELLVVIAIIALLMSIVMPGMRKAKEYARKVICQSNYRQIGVAIGTYEAEFNYNFRNFKSAINIPNADLPKYWFWQNGTADHAHEAAPFAVRYLMENNMLPTREVFFCPGVRNLSYDKNYLRSGVSSGDFTSYNTDDIYYRVKDGTLASNDRPLFWGTSTWIWRKEIRGSVKSVNNTSSNAMMCDMTDSIWNYAKSQDSLLTNFFGVVDIGRAFQHNNVLMADLSVENPSDKDAEVMQWLWNSDNWGGGAF
jgi:prepilin-type N-terminal cleavage/methylation domain-containing protein